MSKAVIIQNGIRTTAPFTPPKAVTELIPAYTQPCGGKGHCGKCRIRIHGKTNAPTDAERACLSRALLSDGIRLACQTTALGDVTIRISAQSAPDKAASSSVAIRRAMGKKFGLAIDLGTTTLYAALYDLQTGEKRTEASALNPQSVWGADVLTRVGHAMQGELHRMSQSIRNALFDICAAALTKARLAPNDVDASVLVGNTAMLYLLFAQDPSCISAAPFTCETRFGDYFPADFLPVSRGAKLYVPRCISAFLGADTTAAALACGLHKQTNVMLTDLGTNGETLLCANGNMLGCSCAAGPAFEGVGLECGMPATDGAIRSVMLSGGQYVYETHGNTAPKGVCGSGVIDWIACMLRRGDLNADGLLHSGTRAYLADTPVYLSQTDVRAFQLAKSAVRTGMEILLREAAVQTVDRLYLAGSFGSALRIRSAAAVGLIPPQLTNASQGVGNAAAQGAAMLLADDALCDTATRFADAVQTVSLADKPDFNDMLCRHMSFGTKEQ